MTFDIFTGFGASADRAFLLGADPHRPEGGMIFELERRVVRALRPLDQQCRTLATGTDGVWFGTYGADLIRFEGRTATILPGPEARKPLAAIWAGHDSLLVAQEDDCVIHRWEGRRWAPVRLPEDATLINSISGPGIHDLSVCTGEGVLHFDGRRAVWALRNDVEEDDPIFLDDEPLSVVNLHDGTSLLVGSQLRRWRRGKHLSVIDGPADDEYCAAAQRLGDAVYLASLKGVVRYADGRATLVNDFPCNGLERLGNGLLAAGSDGGAQVFDGGAWFPIQPAGSNS